jgi:enoyl-CoA hydratase/carnithine racemase
MPPTDHSFETVKLEIANGVATVSLNRPDRHNAVNDQLHDELDVVWEELIRNDSARVILLRGEGKSFCSGRDTTELGERPGGESDLSFVRRHQIERLRVVDLPKPVIGALRGYCLGGGLEMALSTDIRIAADDIQMAFPEIRYGLMTDTGGSAFATMLGGPSRAKWMLMTGTRINAERALQWGLVDQVVSPDELDETAAALAAELADKPVEALAMIKQTVNGMWRGQIGDAIDKELFAQVALFGGEDYKQRKAARRKAQ